MTTGITSFLVVIKALCEYEVEELFCFRFLKGKFSPQWWIFLYWHRRFWACWWLLSGSEGVFFFELINYSVQPGPLYGNQVFSLETQQIIQACGHSAFFSLSCSLLLGAISSSRPERAKSRGKNQCQSVWLLLGVMIFFAWEEVKTDR